MRWALIPAVVAGLLLAGGFRNEGGWFALAAFGVALVSLTKTRRFP